jgi:hypothetical protein
LAVSHGSPPEGYEVPVRKKLLLILPEGDEYEYLCTRCGSSVGIKLEKGKEEVKVLIKP